MMEQDIRESKKREKNNKKKPREDRKSHGTSQAFFIFQGFLLHI